MIRVGSLYDVDACIRLFEIGKRDHPEAYRDITSGSVYADLADGRVLVAEERNHIVGMISSVPSKHKTFLYMLIVDKEHRGGRLAPKLIRAAVEKWGKCSSIIAPHTLPSFNHAGMKPVGYLVETV